MVSRTTGDIADAILSLHLPAMRDLDLESLDLLRKLDTLRVGETSHLAQLIAIDVEHLAHEINYTLRLVKSSGRDVNVEHHFPLRRAHRLMETKPDFATTSKRRRVTVRRREERAANGRVAHGGQVPHDNVERLNGFKRNPMKTTLQRQFQ